MKRFNMILTIIGGISVITAVGFVKSYSIEQSVKNLSSKDTTVIVTPVLGLDTIVDVKGKKSLFIGDSQTSGYGWGWKTFFVKKRE